MHGGVALWFVLSTSHIGVTFIDDRDVVELRFNV
jgi:hypothetical protein